MGGIVRRYVAVALTTAGLVLGAAAPAGAWWAEGTSYFNYTFGIARVYAEPGEVNDLTARSLPTGHALLHDGSAPVTPPPEDARGGCTQLDDHTLLCEGLGFMGSRVAVAGVWVYLGDGDDRLRVPLGSSLYKLGEMGAGNDTVVGDDTEGARINLGDGDDRITLRGAQSYFLPDDSVYGGAGDDVLRVVNGAADDNPVCADGNDTLYADAGESHETCETQHHFP